MIQMILRCPRHACVVFMAALAACAPPVTQILIPPADTELSVRPLVGSLEVRDMSLPRYAASDDLVVLGEDGGIDTLRGLVWADTPERALTLRLADSLGAITGARVAGEPWPFADLPAAQLTVRVSDLLASSDGVLRFRGHYAIAAVDSDLADRDGSFDLSVPLRSLSPQAVAEAHSTALSRLAETVARRIAR